MKINDKCTNPLLKGRNKMILNPYIFGGVIPSDYDIYYKFDNNLNDSGSGGHNLSEFHGGSYTAYSFASDRHGNANGCIRFQNTIDDYQGVSATFGKTFSNGITLSAWIKHAADVPNVNIPIELRNSQFVICTRYRFSTPADLGFIKVGQNVAQNTIDFDNNWHHHVITANGDGSSVYYYIDNSVILSNIACAAPISVTIVLGTGSGNTNPFNGYIDDMYIYPRILTVAERTLLYNQ